MNKKIIRAIFFDRDGTINKDAGYTHKIEDLEFTYRCIEGLKKLSDTDYKKIIITNQSGIARGYYSEDDYHFFTKAMIEYLRQSDVHIDKVYYCPHGPSDTCECRKPQIGLLLQAVKDFNISLSHSWLIGDRPSDIKTGKMAHMRTIKLGDPVPQDMLLHPDYYAAHLEDAIDYIKKVDF